LKEELRKIHKLNSPCYLFDCRILSDRVRYLRQYLGKSVKLCFSVKANPWLVQKMNPYIDYFEVCSAGELEWCLNRGIPAERISVGGVCKTYEDLELAVKAHAGTLSVESANQAEALNRIGNDDKTDTSILLRLSSGNQFGMQWEEVKKHYTGQIKGIHFYSGTQKRSSGRILSELEMLKERLQELERSGRNVKILEYGPGIGYPYFTGDDEAFDQTVLEEISEELRQIGEQYDLRLELGRMLCAPVGSYIAKVIDRKVTEGKVFYILNGGHQHFAYFGQGIGGKNAKFSIVHCVEKERKREKVIVCGSLCTANDILLKNVDIEECDVGDYFIFFHVGAYSSTEAMALFLRHKYPDIYLMEEDGHLVHSFCSDYLI